MASRMKKAEPENIDVNLDVKEVTVSKGLTLALESFGGNKFEMARLDVGMTFRCSEPGNLVEKTKKAWEMVDGEINSQVEELSKTFGKG